MKLSVVIPARNEAGSIGETLRNIHRRLRDEAIEHEIVVVDDGSTDATAEVLEGLAGELPTLVRAANGPPHGFGRAVRHGLARFTGDAVAIMMADASDDPGDLVAFFRALERSGVDCVFGTRFSATSRIVDYPWSKRVVNRLANGFVRLLFGLRYNDVTNAFKLYRRHVIDGVQPILSHHFNLTVELPLKAIVRGYSYTVLPNHWTGRRQGQSKLLLKEMGSRYLFIVLYCFIESWLSAGDYRRAPAEPAAEPLAREAGARR